MLSLKTIGRVVGFGCAVICAGRLVQAQGDNAQTQGQERREQHTTPEAFSEREDREARELGQRREVVVYLKNGQRFNGILVEEGQEKLVIRISGVETIFFQRDLKNYEVLAPVVERYRKLRDSIGDEPEQLLKLVEWLRVREAYQLALQEIDHVLELEPRNGEAIRLRELVEQQLKLKKRSRKSSKSDDDEKKRKKDIQQERHTAWKDFKLLSEYEVNLMKVYEIDLSEKPRVIVERETVERLIEKYKNDPLVPKSQEGREALYQKGGYEILDLMFRLQARELYGEVQVRRGEQPPGMRKFRDDVHAKWLVNSCATTACHGGEEAGRLQLFPFRPRSDATVYTNFLILERFEFKEGVPMINYNDPVSSPLIQLGLAREESIWPHPEVPRGVARRDVWQPVFRSEDDRRVRDAVEWIEAMYRPRPNYPIEYEVEPPEVAEGKEGEPVQR